MADQFDLVVVGGGPGGYASAFYGASAGLNVALIEKDTLGGTCLNRGCIPAKAFLETAAARRHVQHAGELSLNSMARMSCLQQEVFRASSLVSNPLVL